MNWRQRFALEAATVAAVVVKPIDLAAGVIVELVSYPEKLLAFRKAVTQALEARDVH